MSVVLKPHCLQVAIAAPYYGCGCGSIGPAPLPVPSPIIDYIPPGPSCYGGGYYGDYVGSAPGYLGYDAVGPYGAAVVEAPAAYLPGHLHGSYHPGHAHVLPASAPVVSSTSPPVPVGSPKVVSKSAGPASSYVTAPACKTSQFSLPVQSAATATAGPVSESTSIVDGCCSTSCAATCAKCSGTTKKVAFKTPVIIDGGSTTSSTVAIAGSVSASRSTKAGTPEVTTAVYPAPAPAAPAAYYGAGSYYGAAPAFTDVVLGSGAPYYGGEYYPGHGCGVEVFPAPAPVCTCV